MIEPVADRSRLFEGRAGAIVPESRVAASPAAKNHLGEWPFRSPIVGDPEGLFAFHSEPGNSTLMKRKRSRAARVTVRLDLQELEPIRAAAELEQLSIAEFIRDVAVRAARRRTARTTRRS